MHFMTRLNKKTIAKFVARLFKPSVSFAIANIVFIPVYAQTTDAASSATSANSTSTAASTSPRQSLPVTIEADEMQGSLDKEVKLKNNVEIHQGDIELKSDNATYRIIKNEAEAEGNVWMRRLKDHYTGDSAVMDMDYDQGTVQNPTYYLAANGGRGRANKIDFLDKDQAVVTDGTYSTCEAPDPDWYVKANTLEIDSGRDVGTFRDGAVYFKGVPILGAPYLSFPISGERKSGVLPPTIGMTSGGGLEISLPYYFNIAPNRDLTLYPKYIAKRGLQLGLKARYLGETYSGQLTAEGIQDQETHTDRYFFRSQHTQNLSPHVQFGWDVSKASDNDYISDFSRTISGSSQRLLTRNAYIAYADNYWNATARVAKYQLLQDVDDPIQKPYDRAPQLTLMGAQRDWHGFDVELTTDFTRFENSGTLPYNENRTLVGGDRAYINTSIAYPFIQPGYFITPKLSFDATSYKLNNMDVGQPKSLDRTVPTASLDMGMRFEREMSLLGHSLTQTLEPRLFYVRTPYRDQSEFPNFDSGNTDFNFAQIFSENRFVGHDRIGDANQVTTGVVSRFIESDGEELLRLAFAQRFYFSDPQVLLDGTAETIKNSKSDMLFAASGQVTPQIHLDSAIQYSQTLNKTVRANYGVGWEPAPKKVLNLSYRLDRSVDVLKQIEISGQWPIFQRWYAVGRVNYSIPDHRIAESLAGFEYQADCWVLRFVAQRMPTSSTKTSTSFFMQLELTGFSSIGTSPIDVLTNNISGYEPVH